MTKRGGMEEHIVMIVLFLIFLIIMGMGIGRYFGLFQRTTNEALAAQLDEQLAKCKALGKQGRTDLGDGDGLPDQCDNCPLIKNDLSDRPDVDKFPFGCCGNSGGKTGDFNFLREPSKGFVAGNYKESQWCRNPEDNTLNQRPQQPKYDPILK